MNLKSRLSQLQTQSGARPATGGRADSAPSLNQRLAHLRPERLTGLTPTPGQAMSEEALAKALGGHWIADGLLKIEETVSIAELPGFTGLSNWNDRPRLPGETTPAPSIYIDTETTGLSGGSGTLAFLVGLAVVSGKQIILSQYLITRFTAEASLLTTILEQLPPSHRLVSYNGKSYDLPLLVTRLRMQGRLADLENREHLDLLHPIRRLFKRRWEDCRLTTVERRLLGFTRQDDLPGAEAPAAWFAYMQRQEGGKLIRVVEHNRQDILSLAAIHHSIANIVAAANMNDIDFHGLGRWLMEIDESMAIARLSIHQDCLCDDAKRLLGFLLRRAQHWNKARLLWEELASRGCVDSIERLAKYHEHISHDLNTALHYCSMLPGSSLDIHRRERIEKKLVEEKESHNFDMSQLCDAESTVPENLLLF